MRPTLPVSFFPRTNPVRIVYATICLTQLLDIKPTLCGKLVALGGVTQLCKRLENVASIELVEHVIKALEKVAIENPYAILASHGLSLLASLLDFFDFPLQVLFPFC